MIPSLLGKESDCETYKRVSCSIVGGLLSVQINRPTLGAAPAIMGALRVAWVWELHGTAQREQLAL